MHKSKVITAALAALALASIFSCKKDNGETTLPSLSGTLKFKKVPSFVNPQDEITLTLNGVTHPDGGKIGYSITIVEGYKTTKDTLDEGVMSLKYVFSNRKYFKEDTLRTVSVSASAFADGYYSSSTGTQSITIVKGGMTEGSINWTTLPKFDESFGYKGIKYYAKKNGDATWLMRNVASKNKGLPYQSAPAMLDVFGSYLNWEDAKTACPTGYRLTTDEDWVNLGKSLGVTDAKVHETIAGIAPQLMIDATFNYDQTTLWTYWKGMDISNKSGLSVLPTGWANLATGQFSGVKEYAVFWTADTYEVKDKEGNIIDDTQAYCRVIYERSQDVSIELHDKESFGASVRCVKE